MIASLSAHGGGIVEVPPGNYCLKGGLTITGASVILKGAGQYSTELQTCGGQMTLLTLNSQFSEVRQMNIAGPDLTDTGAAPIADAVVFGPACERCLVDSTRVSGGAHAIRIDAPDVTLANSEALDAYGASVVVVRAGGSYMLRDTFDQNWPVAIPRQGSSSRIDAWAAGTAYGAGAMVTRAGFYLRARTAGTSGATAPVPHAYSLPASDGVLTWALVAPTTYYAVQYDSGASESFAWGCDYSGPFTAGIALTNSSGDPARAPQSITIQTATIGQIMSYGVYAHDGNALTVVDPVMTDAAMASSAGVDLAGSWKGDVDISDNLMFAMADGVRLEVGTGTIVARNQIFGARQAGVYVASGTSDFEITDNALGKSSSWGPNNTPVMIAAGRSDFYGITNNLVHGASGPIVDEGTGIHKVISGNR